jgi:hypothetical protein
MVDRNIEKYLLYVCKNGHMEMIQNVDEKIIHQHFTDIFYVACLRGQLLICQWLLNIHPTINFDDFAMPTFTSVEFKDMDFITWLFLTFPTLYNVVNIRSLFYSACYYCKIDMAISIYNLNPVFQLDCLEWIYENNFDWSYNRLEISKWLYLLDYNTIIASPISFYYMFGDNNSNDNIMTMCKWILTIYKTYDIIIPDDEIVETMYVSCDHDNSDVYNLFYDLLIDKSIINYRNVFAFALRNLNITVCNILYIEQKIILKDIENSIIHMTNHSIDLCIWLLTIIPDFLTVNYEKLIKFTIHINDLVFCKWIFDSINYEQSMLSLFCHHDNIEMFTWFYKDKIFSKKIIKHCFDVVCKNNNVKIKQYLIDNEQCVMSKHHYKLAMYNATKNEDLDKMKQLYYGSHGIVLNEDNCLYFNTACKYNYLNICKWLWSMCLTIDLHLNNCSVFNQACKNNNFTLCKWLYSLDNTVLTVRSTEQVSSCRKEIYLWMYKVKPELIDVQRMFNNFEDIFNIAKWLYENNSDKINLQQLDHTTFRNACKHRDINMCKWLSNLFPDTYKIISINEHDITYKIYKVLPELTKSIILIDVESCTICYETSNVISSCMHMFCINCLREWLSEKDICPMCRTPIKYEDCSTIKID